MSIVPAKFEHVKTIQRLEGIFFTGVNDDVHVKEVLKNSIGFTMLENEDTIIGCGGVIKQWPGVGTWWLLASRDVKNHTRTFFVSAQNLIDLIHRHHNFHRFQAFVDPDQPRHIRFVEALGFTFEGKMIQHTVDRKDHLLYARTF